MSTLHADVAVVGTEICALAAGAWLAHQGRRVVVLDDGELESAPLGGFMVPRAPALFRLPASGPASVIFDKLGLRQDARRVVGDPVGIGVIADPEARFVLPVDRGARQKELARVYGMATGDSIAAALDGHALDGRDPVFEETTHLHVEGFFARRRTKSRLADPERELQRTDASVDALVRAGFGPVLEAAVPFVQWSTTKSAAGMTGHIAAASLLTGSVAHSKEGLGLRSALFGLFAKVVQGHGGDVISDSRVEHVEVKRQKAVHIRTQGKNDYAVSAIIDGTRQRTLSERVQSEKHSQRSASLDKRVGQAGGAVIVRWLVPRGMLPRGIPVRALMLFDDAEPALLGVYDDLPLEKPGQKSAVPTGLDEPVAVLLARRTERPTQEADADRLERCLSQLMPFADRARVAHDRVYGADAAVTMPTYRIDDAQNAFGGRSMKTALKNVFRAGRDLCPGLGLEGELSAAMSCARAAESVLGQSK